MNEQQIIKLFPNVEYLQSIQQEIFISNSIYKTNELVKISVETLIKYKDLLNWTRISSNKNTFLSFEHFIFLKDKLVYGVTFLKSSLSADEIQNYNIININNGETGGFEFNISFTESFISEVEDRLDWFTFICNYSQITPNLILEFHEKISISALIRNSNLPLDSVIFILDLIQLENQEEDKKARSYKYFTIIEKYTNFFTDKGRIGVDLIDFIQRNNTNTIYTESVLKLISNKLKENNYDKNYMDFLIGNPILNDNETLYRFSENIDLWKVAEKHQKIFWEPKLFQQLIGSIDCLEDYYANIGPIYGRPLSKLDPYDLLSKINIPFETAFLFAPVLIKEIKYDYERRRNGHGEYVDDEYSFFLYEKLISNPVYKGCDYLKDFFYRLKVFKREITKKERYNTLVENRKKLRVQIACNIKPDIELLEEKQFGFFLKDFSLKPSDETFYYPTYKNE